MWAYLSVHGWCLLGSFAGGVLAFLAGCVMTFSLVMGRVERVRCPDCGRMWPRTAN